MFGNYLGIKKAAADKRAGPTHSKVKATPSTKCQKCLQMGHYSFECTGKVAYHVRPTRTQQLKNPKLRTKLTESHPPRTEEMPKEGTAAAILEANEKKRADKLAASTRRARSSSTSSSSSSSSSSSGSDSGSSSSGSDSGSSSSGSSSGSDSQRDRDEGGKRSRRRRRSSTPPADKRRRTDDAGDRKGKGRAVDQD